MNNVDRKFMLFGLSLMIGLCSSSVQAGSHKPLICSVIGSQDVFKVYPNQLTYSSDQFSHYQLIDGLTILVIHNKTMRFNRLSNLNLLAHSTMDPGKPPENYQLFNGQCKIAKPLENE